MECFSNSTDLAIQWNQITEKMKITRHTIVLACNCLSGQLISELHFFNLLSTLHQHHHVNCIRTPLQILSQHHSHTCAMAHTWQTYSTVP